MSEQIRNLEPKILWNHFADLNAVPRGSKKEEKVIQFMVEFGQSYGLETSVDHVGNVIITKPASPGMEDRKTVVLQSHLDMVHQKNSDTEFDFDKEGIRMLLDGEWVKADGTTLGADNGLGVAAIMAILSSNDLSHPRLEALFTIDEETGMTGAQGLQGGMLDGEILLNLDTEEEDEIDIGCAGGIDVTAKRSYEMTATPSGYLGHKIVVKGLQGGHSGMDIDKGLGNANKIMNEILVSLRPEVELSSLQGGSLRNAIPRESFATVSWEADNDENIRSRFNEVATEIKERFKELEPEMSISLEKEDVDDQVMVKEDVDALLQSLEKAHNGVFKMSEEIEGLVEASNNIAKVTAQGGKMQVDCLTRSSVEDSKMEVAEGLKAVFESEGFEVAFSGSYPGWSPNRNSPILKVMSGLYTDLFGSEPRIVACHAGLECGILGTNYPDMDMISFGPTIKGAHSPDERAHVPSVGRFWSFLKETLVNIPSKN